MAVVLILGVLLVTYSRSQRDVSALAPTLRDHWHSAYSVWNCETEDYENQFNSDLILAVSIRIKTRCFTFTRSPPLSPAMGQQWVCSLRQCWSTLMTAS